MSKFRLFSQTTMRERIEFKPIMLPKEVSRSSDRVRDCRERSEHILFLGLYRSTLRNTPKPSILPHHQAKHILRLEASHGSEHYLPAISQDQECHIFRESQLFFLLSLSRT